MDRKAIAKTVATGITETIPDRWCAFAIKTSGGTATLTDSDGNTLVIADGDTFSYGDPDGSRGYLSWTVEAGAGATVLLVYNT